ncbi:MAG: DUF4382 domain-containing protein, partial [Gammaproteobacteria bacterium]
MKRKNFVLTFLCFTGILGLTACSSGGDAETTLAGGGRGGIEYGFLTLSITDVPVDNATEVWLQIDGVELLPESESAEEASILILFDQPMSINLLDSEEENSVALLFNEILPTGSYYWLKLIITAVNDGVMDSYIRLDDGSVHELVVPADSEEGLQITDGVEIIANTPSAITIVFDLSKSVQITDSGDFELNPDLNLVDD